MRFARRFAIGLRPPEGSGDTRLEARKSFDNKSEYIIT